MIRALREHSPDTEIVVISGSASLRPRSRHAARRLRVRAKPFEADQLFATLQRARRASRRGAREPPPRLGAAADQRRGEELRHLLEPEDLIQRVLERLMRGMGVEWGAARLSIRRWALPTCASSTRRGAMREGWGTSRRTTCWPSERVLATRAPFRVGDFHQGLDPGSPRRVAAAVDSNRADVRRRGSDRRVVDRQPAGRTLHA